jgi:hypothetical protein
VSYVDLNTIHNPATGTIAPASWGDQARDNFEFLIDPPMCSVYASTAQAVATGTSTALTADSENYDSDAMHSTVSNTSRITAQEDGRYELTAMVFYAAGTGRRVTSFLVNGTTALNGDSRVSAVTGGAAGVTDQVSISRTVTLTAGDYVEVRVNQNSGGNLNVTLDEFTVKFEAR